MQADSGMIIKEYYRAFNEKNWETFFLLMDEKIVHDINHGKKEVGKALFRKFMERMNVSYDEQITDIVVMTESSGKRIAAEYVVLGSYLKTDSGLPEARGQKYKLPGGAFFQIENQKITRVTNYYNLDAWLEQVR